jgi:hypothetical protein
MACNACGNKTVVKQIEVSKTLAENLTKLVEKGILDKNSLIKSIKIK